MYPDEIVRALFLRVMKLSFFFHSLGIRFNTGMMGLYVPPQRKLFIVIASKTALLFWGSTKNAILMGLSFTLTLPSITVIGCCRSLNVNGPACVRRSP